MKKHHYISLLAFMFVPLLAWSQEQDDRYRIYVSAGLNAPTGQELSYAHGPGFNGQIGLGIRTIKNLYLGPIMDYSFHRKQYSDRLDEQFDSYGFGLGAYYSHPLNEKMTITPMLKGYYVSYTDKYLLRERSNLNVNILEGNDLAFDIGAGPTYSRWSLNLAYRFFNASPTFNSDFYETYLRHNIIYPVFTIQDSYSMNFSSIIVSVGVKFGAK